MTTPVVRINLLPHREQKRAARQRQFISLAGVARASSASRSSALVHGFLATQIDNQKSRNTLLKGEIAKLDEQIKEIDKLRDQIQPVLARKQVVETLQANRSEAVHLLDQLVRQLPDGIYLKSIKQAGAKVTMVGYAQSQRARVHADAQHRGVAVARRTRAGRDQARAAPARRTRPRRPEDQRVHPELPGQARAPPLDVKAASAHGAGQAGRRRPRRAQGSQGMNLEDIRRLNLREVGNWPVLPKVAILTAIVRRHRRARRAASTGRTSSTRSSRTARGDEAQGPVQREEGQAINFDLYVQQLKEVEQSFGALVKQLPNRAEIDALLTDINQAGLGRGLQFELFKPAAQEKMAEFYAELPINIRSPATTTTWARSRATSRSCRAS